MSLSTVEFCVLQCDVKHNENYNNMLSVARTV